MQIKPLAQGLFIIAILLVSWQTLTPKPIETLATHVNDKAGHLLAFAVLFLLLKEGWQNLSFYTVFFLLLSYGIGIEVCQYFIPNRSFSIADIVADGLGELLGGVLVYLTFNLKKRFIKQ